MRVMRGCGRISLMPLPRVRCICSFVVWGEGPSGSSLYGFPCNEEPEGAPGHTTDGRMQRAAGRGAGPVPRRPPARPPGVSYARGPSQPALVGRPGHPAKAFYGRGAPAKAVSGQNPLAGCPLKGPCAKESLEGGGAPRTRRRGPRRPGCPHVSAPLVSAFGRAPGPSRGPPWPTCGESPNYRRFSRPFVYNRQDSFAEPRNLSLIHI